MLHQKIFALFELFYHLIHQFLYHLMFCLVIGLIKKIRIFDVFQGGNIEKNKKSIALNLLIQSQEKTLNDKEIEQLSDKVIITMQNSFDATLRS